MDEKKLDVTEVTEENPSEQEVDDVNEPKNSETQINVVADEVTTDNDVGVEEQGQESEGIEEKADSDSDDTSETVSDVSEEVTPPEPEEKNAKTKKSKKGLVAGLLALVLAGGGYYAYDQTKRNEAHQEALDKIELSVVKETLDYADSDPVDTLTLVKATGDVTADVDKIDVRKVGKTKIKYTVETLDSYGATASKTFEQEFEVVDKAAPVIELSEETVSIYAGDGFSESDYISSVKDPVDGDLTAVGSEDKKPTDKGWYSITSDVAADTPGNYTVKVHAEDKNGNKADKELAVTVSERPVVAATPTYNETTSTYAATNNYSGYSSGYNDYSGYSGGYNDYSGYSGGGGNSYSDSGGSSYVAETPAETYVAPAAPAVDYSIPAGTFASSGEAYAYGNAQIDADDAAWLNGTLSNPRSGFYVDSNWTAAGVQYWTVTFY